MRPDLFTNYERVRMSNATRLLLCDFAAADLARRLHHGETDWNEVWEGVCRNGLLGLTNRYLTHGLDRDVPPVHFRRAIQDTARARALRMTAMYRRIGRVLARLNEIQLEHLILKGPALAYGIYPNPALREFNDLDLMIRESDWARAHDCLGEMGFVSEFDYPQPPPKLVAPAMQYEMKYWHAQAKLLVEVHYDDLLNAGLAARGIEDFWQRRITIDMDGTPIQTLALDDQLLHACAHAHFHGYTRLYWFSDIALIVREHSGALDWERFIRTVRIEEAQTPIFYTLLFLERLLNISVPARVLNAIQPDAFRRRWHEFYLPENKVLAWQPMRRPVFSFYFMPLFERLIPDLLVMGRRGDKLGYLLRLFFPPPAWLRFYYRLGNSDNVILHYVLHPLKLVTHYLIEAKNVLKQVVASRFRRYPAEPKRKRPSAAMTMRE